MSKRAISGNSELKVTKKGNSCGMLGLMQR